ncbi:MAG: cadherin-like domain-containing protein [Pseudomonadota bacterium]|nr:cadherin-like domain-containing protein [Pseudomonadota bacterium]
MNTCKNKSRSLLALAIAASLVACGGSENKAPAFSQSSFAATVSEDESVTGTLSASDPDSNDTLNFTLASAASNGVFELNGNGSYTYTPNGDFFGEDSVTVTVSDGKLSDTATVTFTVTNVNDAPVVGTSQVTVSSQGTTTGSIEITDADGDDITITVITAPQNGQLEINSATGEFEYTPYTLEQIDGSFTIAVTDGVISDPVEAEISLAASFSTNADKLSYYYSSAQSHLKQAEARMENIIDDDLLNEVRAGLAVGYTTAGFASEADANIAAITTLDDQARAYQAVGERLDTLGLTEEGDDKRASSVALFNQYLAEKGISNLSSSDANYFIGLINDYEESGNADAANAMLTSVRIYADAINDDEYSTAYGRLLSASRINVSNQQTAYFESGSDADLDSALTAAGLLEDIAMEVGYRVITRGDYEGQYSYQMRVLYVTWLAEHYMYLNQPEKAKQYLAEALALYGVSGYDANYNVEASEYGAATLSSYSSIVEIQAGLFAYYYPDAETNLALALLEPGTRNYNDAIVFIHMYQVLAAAEKGEDFSDLLASVKTHFEENGDLRDYYEFLVQQGAGSGSGIRTAGLLVNRGHLDAALTVLDEALTVLTDEDYIYSESAKMTLGSYGCAGLSRLYQKAGGDVNGVLNTCLSIAENYYQPEQNIMSDAAIIEGYQALLTLYAEAGNTEVMNALASDMSVIAQSFDSDIDALEFQAYIASVTANYGAFESAVVMSNSVLTGIVSLMKDDEGNTLEALEGYLEVLLWITGSDDYVSSYFKLYTVKTAMRRQAADITEFAALFSQLQTQLHSTLQVINTAVTELSDNEQQDIMASILLANARAGLFAEAEQFAASEVNATADQYELYAQLAVVWAEKDDYPGSKVANVDTDNDGLPNFFLTTATEQEIAESGLIADTDSDNDGIADEQDATPLGEGN